MSAYHPAFVRGYRLWVVPSFDRSHTAILLRNRGATLVPATQLQVDEDDVQFLSDDDTTDHDIVTMSSQVGNDESKPASNTVIPTIGAKKGNKKAASNNINESKGKEKSNGATAATTAATATATGRGGKSVKGLHRDFKHVPAQAVAFIASAKVIDTSPI
jgi:hypothetical protein